MSELTPVGLGAARHLLRASRPSGRDERRAQAARAATRYTQPQAALATASRSARGWSASARSRSKPIVVDRRARRLRRRSRSSLGEAPPRNIVVLPVLFEGQVKGVIELGSFQRVQPDPPHLPRAADAQSIGVVFNMISASMRTEELLEELKRSNVELEKRTKELEEKASLLEVEEPRDRRGQRLARGEGQAARAGLQVQVRVPRQHVATSCARRSTAC